MNRIAVAVVAAVLLLAAASSSLFVVQRGQAGAVYAMGRVERVLQRPGLYLKWPSPMENVVLLDQRVLTLRSERADSFPTSDKHDLVLRWFVKWRIADPSSYLRSFGDNESAAEDRLASAMRSQLGAEIASMSLQSVLREQDARIPQQLRMQLSKTLHASGIDVTDAGLTEVDYTADATDSVYRRMAAARKLVAGQIRAEGQAQADKIRAEADRQREVLLAQAYRKAQTLKGEGDAQAASIYAASFGKDPEFAAFYRSLEAYRASFDSRRDVMVLDPSSDFFRFMRNPDGKPAAAPRSRR